MTVIEDTTATYDMFESAARKYLGDQQLNLIEQMPPDYLYKPIGRDEIKFITACATLAKSTHFPPEADKAEEIQFLRSWARRTTRKSFAKIGENRCLELLNCLMSGPDFERRYLPRLFLILVIEKDKV